MSDVKVTFQMEKDTKNTIRFAEKLEHPMDVAVIGTLYVPKSTLKAIGYREGGALTVTLSAN